MLVIRSFCEADFAAVQTIYQQGIDSGKATFQLTAKSWSEWHESLLPQCRLVVQQGNAVVAWAGLSAISKRPVYAGVAEMSIYVAIEVQAQGVGSSLMRRLVTDSEAAGFWTLQAGIFTDNAASIALHSKHGFRAVGTRDKLGQLHGQWRDVLLMERRSQKVGV